MVADPDPPARVEDVHELAAGMPYVRVVRGPSGNPVYQVGGKSFVFFRTPRPDATDPDTGKRYTDVIIFWVPSESEKLALTQDPTSPFFTTSHFDGHCSVLAVGRALPRRGGREFGHGRGCGRSSGGRTLAGSIAVDVDALWCGRARKLA
jgi:hypothetical protein